METHIWWSKLSAHTIDQGSYKSVALGAWTRQQQSVLFFDDAPSLYRGAMSFSLLAAGCRFNERHRDERKVFATHQDPHAMTASSSAAGLGGLDFFSGGAAASSSVSPAEAGGGGGGGGVAGTKPSKKRSKAERANARGDDELAEEAGGGASVEAAKRAAAAMTERDVADANALRRAMRIHVYGIGVAAPVQSAEHMADTYALRPWLRRNILEAGYHELTRIQMQAVPVLLSGREVLACAPTGSGKTAAFLIPMLARLGAPRRQGVRAVAIAPTQELARQTHRELLKLSDGSGLQACVLSKKLANAATSYAEQHGGSRKGDKDANGGGGGGGVWRKYDALVCTPLRLVSLLRKGALSLDSVEYLALDEADKLLELGFLEQVDEILAACKGETVQRALFSATMQPQIEDLVNSVLHSPVKVVVGERNAAAETVEQKLVFCGREDGKLVALRQIVREGIRPPVLIFVQSVDRAVQLFHSLVYDGLNVDVLHADRTQAQRDATVQKFRAGKVWVLIATELVARGMDFKGVSLVINYDFPQSDLLHPPDRPDGPCGAHGRAITFFTEADAEMLRSIANVMKASGCEVADWMLKMKPPRKDVKKRRASAPSHGKPYRSDGAPTAEQVWLPRRAAATPRTTVATAVAKVPLACSQEAQEERR